MATRYFPGHVFGRLKVIRFVGSVPGSRLCLCRCECGTEKVLKIGNLRNEHTKSCGCLRRELSGLKNLTHGQAGPTRKTREYNCWCTMIARCCNTNNPAYDRYGGRGIKVCEQWRTSFETFFSHMGKSPGLDYSLDRWPNNDGNYEPGNVRWATAEQQAKNTRVNANFTLFGRTQCMSDWAKEVGIKNGTLWCRIQRYGWSPERAILTPCTGKREPR